MPRRTTDDHSVDIRERGGGNSSRGTRDVEPVNRFATDEADAVGSSLTNRCT